jgi:chromosome partitioning protein
MIESIATSTAAAENMQSSSMQQTIGLSDIAEIARKSDEIIDYLQSEFKSEGRTLSTRFTISQAADLVRRSAQAIRDAEKQGKLRAPELNEKGRRSGYTLGDINAMRRFFGTAPIRNKQTDDPIILAMQSFKGGVGKSTFTVHLAQYLAIQGYRVCVIDTDSQATTTTLFGYNPDADVAQDETIFPYMNGEKDGLEYSLHDTHWDQLKLIPANLELYGLEYSLAGYIARADQSDALDTLLMLRRGIHTIEEQFDVILIDPPPALGMISLSVLNAANSMVVPTRPSATDFASTAQFFKMLRDTYEQFMAAGLAEPRFKFLKVVVNALDESKSAHAAISEMMSDVYGTARLNSTMKNSAEIDNATARLMTVYELNAPITSRDVHRRCKAYLKSVNSEIEFLIRKSWPSHRDALRNEGRV